jgi:transposase
MPKASGKGAPTAKQVADRFHLTQNLRENIERGRRRAAVISAPPRREDVAE